LSINQSKIDKWGSGGEALEKKVETLPMVSIVGGVWNYEMIINEI
jgi:hypothetical protein